MSKNTLHYNCLEQHCQFLNLFLHPQKNTVDYDRHFKNGKGTGAEMCPAIVSKIVTGDAIGHFFLVPRYSLRSLNEN